MLPARCALHPPRPERVGILRDGENAPAVQAGDVFGGQSAEETQVVLLDGRRSTRPPELALRTVPVQEQRRRRCGLPQRADLADGLTSGTEQGHEPHPRRLEQPAVDNLTAARLGPLDASQDGGPEGEPEPVIARDPLVWG